MAEPGPRRTSEVRRRQLQLEQSAGAARAARRFATSVAAEVGVSHRLDDLAVVVSELVTNAVEHGRGPVALEIEADPGDGVLVRVTDAGEGEPTVLPASRTRRRGRGLALVRALADRWGVDRGPTGKTVWASFG